MTDPASAKTICSMPVLTLPQLAASCRVEDERTIADVGIARIEDRLHNGLFCRIND